MQTMKLARFLNCISVSILTMILVPLSSAVERSLSIEAPAKVEIGQQFAVAISASSDAGGGERIGFLQVEASMDDGKTWSPMAYIDNVGSAHRHEIYLKAETNSRIKVRAKVAFRDGLAGDVDYTGAAILWDNSWKDWELPPAKVTTIRVKD